MPLSLLDRVSSNQHSVKSPLFARPRGLEPPTDRIQKWLRIVSHERRIMPCLQRILQIVSIEQTIHGASFALHKLSNKLSRICHTLWPNQSHY